ncbi:MAG: class I SAM-dependent methyltransferase [Candidatus Aenigmatarchaeota archaeon]
MATKFFSKIYTTWENKQIKKYEKILDILKDNAIDIKRCRSLNIGCSGFFLEKFLIERELLPKFFVSIDIDRSVLEEFISIRKILLKNRINFILASGESMPFCKESFDLVFCIDVSHLLNSLEEIYATLARGGYLVLSSFFNLYNKERIRERLIKMLERFKILKEFLLFEEESEIIFLAKKMI